MTMIDDATIERMAEEFSAQQRLYKTSRYNAMRAAVKVADLIQCCPHVYISDEGTQHCTLPHADTARAEKAQQRIRMLEALLQRARHYVAHDLSTDEEACEIVDQIDQLIGKKSPERSEPSSDENSVNECDHRHGKAIASAR